MWASIPRQEPRQPLTQTSATTVVLRLLSSGIRRHQHTLKGRKPCKFTPFDRSYSPWLYIEHQGNVPYSESHVSILCPFPICYPGQLLPRMAASVLLSSTLHDPALVPYTVQPPLLLLGPGPQPQHLLSPAAVGKG